MSLLFVLVTLKAQDRIYFESGQKNAKIIEISNVAIKYKDLDLGGMIFSVSANSVKLAFNSNGKYLVFSKINFNDAEGRQMVTHFLKDTVSAVLAEDVIYTAQKKILHCKIIKESPASVSVDINGVEATIDKSTIVLIIRRNQEHQLFAKAGIVADILWDFKKEMIKNIGEEKWIISLHSNQSLAVKFYFNDSLMGIVKKGSVKKIQLPRASYKVHMDDGLGNVFDQLLDLSNSLPGKEIKLDFPVIDYARQYLMKKNELMKAYIIRESEVKSFFLNCREIQKNLAADSALIVNGAKGFDTKTVLLMENFQNSFNQFKTARQKIADEYSKTVLKANETDLEKWLNAEGMNSVNATYKYLSEVKNNEKVSSKNLAIAIKTNRINDFKFFIADSTFANYKIEGYTLLSYALKNKCDPTVTSFIISKSKSDVVNSFSNRMVYNPMVYESPLAIAAIAGDIKNLQVLFKAGAHLYPKAATKKEMYEQIKYVAAQCRSNSAVHDLFQQHGYILTDFEMEAKNIVDSILANMIFVEGGDYTIGCQRDPHEQCVNSEKPAVLINLDSYYISRFEVTHHEWKLIMENDGPGMFKDCENCPVDEVSYDTAIAFINKLNSLSKLKFRLPTEAEWEYACSGGKIAKSHYQFSGSDDYNDVAWTMENAGESTHPVGQKQPNDLGIYDMSGNVMEWCSDWFAESSYQQIQKVNPSGPATGSRKVLRGGSWMLNSWNARVTRRYGEVKNFLNNAIGFRLAITEKP